MGPSVALLIGLVCLASCAGRHKATGLVLAVKSPMVTISHAEVAGVMPAMAMEFRAAPEQLRGLRPGSRVDFIISGNRAKSIRAQASVFEGVELPLRKPAETLKLGEAVPNFTLRDHRGQPFELATANLAAVTAGDLTGGGTRGGRMIRSP